MCFPGRPQDASCDPLQRPWCRMPRGVEHVFVVWVKRESPIGPRGRWGFFVWCRAPFASKAAGEKGTRGRLRTGVLCSVVRPSPVVVDAPGALRRVFVAVISPVELNALLSGAVCPQTRPEAVRPLAPWSRGNPRPGIAKGRKVRASSKPRSRPHPGPPAGAPAPNVQPCSPLDPMGSVGLSAEGTAAVLAAQPLLSIERSPSTAQMFRLAPLRPPAAYWTPVRSPPRRRGLKPYLLRTRPPLRA